MLSLIKPFSSSLGPFVSCGIADKQEKLNLSALLILNPLEVRDSSRSTGFWLAKQICTVCRLDIDSAGTAELLLSCRLCPWLADHISIYILS